MKTKGEGSQLAKMARKSMKAVVQIFAEGISDEDNQSVLDPRYNVPASWSGSGFLIKVNKEPGYVITNSHVVRNARSILAYTYTTSEESFALEVVGQVASGDPDVALLKFKKGEYKRFLSLSKEEPFLIFANYEKVQRGMEIKAIGYPMGMDEPHVSGGEISNFVAGGINFTERMVTDVPINPGNSGGPAINNEGKVIGINTSIIAGANNIGFITPINYVEILLANLMDKGRGELAEIGARLQKNSQQNAKFLNVSEVEGVICTYIEKGGLFDTLGIKKWDVVLSINSIQFDRHGLVVGKGNFRHRNIYDIMRLIPIGQHVEIVISRDGELITKSGPAIGLPKPRFGSNYIMEEREFIFFEGMIIQKVNMAIIQTFLDVIPEAYERFFAHGPNSPNELVVTNLFLDGQAPSLALEVGDGVKKVDGHVVKGLSGVCKRINHCIEKKQPEILVEMHSGALACFDLREMVKQNYRVKIERSLDYVKHLLSGEDQ